MPEPIKRQTTAPKPAEAPKLPAKKELSASERFTGMVMNEYKNVVGSNFKDFPDHVKRLIAGYFIVIDQALAKAEADRVRKNANNKDRKYDNNLPYSWKTVDCQDLSRWLAHYAHIGLDMSCQNHLSPVPYKNPDGDQYTMSLMPGYVGKRYKAKMYAITPPISDAVECVYENDTFKVYKKDRNTPVECYEFTINDPFKRGKLIGVFGYLEYEKESNNILLFFNREDVLKRKPKYASAEFWGGEKSTWENGQQTKAHIDGWEPEMFRKTMYRALYSENVVLIDPKKIDASYAFVRAREEQFAEEAIEAEIADNGNGEPLTLAPPEAPAKAPYVPDTTEPLPFDEPVPLTERAAVGADDPESAF